MTLNTDTKATIAQKFQRSSSDTGSPEVQIALLSARITALTDHMKTHKKDVHSRRGLIAIVNRRRSLLTYLKRKNQASYSNIIQELGLRK